ncbi:hypothetical protein MIC97_20810 [Aquamicrobium sp. NLF2-7]|uniref:hypothetical protein n=1 Tax=Aquamicrobium sp. NLF2-7 TaxID=2918753 RepID=UPI001EFB58F2|nr:hypothetical protein [Aquamicrobium sp. NLF2-7]MCG8273928.1 hypothetical protein [Aquamicrobium sp. NLF2-7]
MKALDEHDLSRMEAACRRTRGQLDLLERQMRERAKRMTLTIRSKSGLLRRCRLPWTLEDERLFRAQVDALAFERRGELNGLREQLAREETAIAGLRARRSPGNRTHTLNTKGWHHATLHD